jgi:hypothetical protein
MANEVDATPITGLWVHNLPPAKLTTEQLVIEAIKAHAAAREDAAELSAAVIVALDVPAAVLRRAFAVGVFS